MRDELSAGTLFGATLLGARLDGDMLDGGIDGPGTSGRDGAMGVLALITGAEGSLAFAGASTLGASTLGDLPDSFDTRVVFTVAAIPFAEAVDFAVERPRVGAAARATTTGAEEPERTRPFSLSRAV